MRSIERYLLGWLVGVSALGAVLLALGTYLVVLEEMNETFDASLRNVARAVAGHPGAGREPGASAAVPAARRGDAAPHDGEIASQTWTPSGERVYASDPRVSPPFSTVEGFARAVLHDEDWIVYTHVRPDGVTQAAQSVSARREMARESVAKVFPPMLVLGVVVAVLLLIGLRRGLRPLDAAARDVAARSARSLDPIATDAVPREIVPLVVSINGLMQRLSAALSAQRSFLADAAHELRTPVTALRLQLQLFQRSGDDASRAQAAAELASGIDRMQWLIVQLLQVARSEPGGEALRDEPVDLQALVRSVVGAMSVKAAQYGIDLGASGSAGAVVRGDDEQLTVLLNNLVENALRYTPAGGGVDVEADLRDGRPVLRVVDDGPGIAPAEAERVFDRFYRGENARSSARDPGGSGLGLAIVRAIAERHGASVSLHTPALGRGLEVRVLFPLPPGSRSGHASREAAAGSAA